MIARIHSASPHVRRLIHQLLSDVGKEHPQALVYSVTVASKSQNVPRKKAALAIMDKMRTHSATLVEQVNRINVPFPLMSGKKTEIFKPEKIYQLLFLFLFSIF